MNRAPAPVTSIEEMLLNRLGRRRGCERIARPSASDLSTTALRPANRTSTDPGSTSPDASMRRRTASGVALTEVISAADAGAGLGSLALAPGNIGRTNTSNAPATRYLRHVAVSGARGSVGGRRALKRHTIQLRRARGLPHGLVITWWAHRALFRGALVRALARATGGLSMPYTRHRVDASDLRTPWTPCPSGGDPPRPRGLGPLPRCGVAATHLLRPSRPAHCAGGTRGAARADDHPPGVAWSLRPPPAAGAGDAPDLALRLGQRRSGVRSPLPRRSLSRRLCR